MISISHQFESHPPISAHISLFRRCGVGGEGFQLALNMHRHSESCLPGEPMGRDQCAFHHVAISSDTVLLPYLVVEQLFFLEFPGIVVF